MTKNDRLNTISDLIERYEISTQEELTERLNSLGYPVSQATVSRDINELNLIKGEGVEKKLKYIKPVETSPDMPPKIMEHFKQIILSIEYANNLIIIKTLSGNGGAAGNAIDQMKIKEILGTVAGDDTLLIVARNNSDAEKIVKTLRTF